MTKSWGARVVSHLYFQLALADGQEEIDLRDAIRLWWPLHKSAETWLRIWSSY
jgi:hypothetical protein